MDLVASWAVEPDAALADDDKSATSVAAWVVLIGTLGLMLLPAAISVSVLLGLLS